MIAPNKEYHGVRTEPPCVAEVLCILRELNQQDRYIIHLEVRALLTALWSRGCRTDAATAESVRSWLLVDELEITA